VNFHVIRIVSPAIPVAGYKGKFVKPGNSGEIPGQGPMKAFEGQFSGQGQPPPPVIPNPAEILGTSE